MKPIAFKNTGKIPLGIRIRLFLNQLLMPRGKCKFVDVCDLFSADSRTCTKTAGMQYGRNRPPGCYRELETKYPHMLRRMVLTDYVKLNLLAITLLCVLFTIFPRMSHWYLVPYCAEISISITFLLLCFERRLGLLGAVAFGLGFGAVNQSIPIFMQSVTGKLFPMPTPLFASFDVGMCVGFAFAIWYLFQVIHKKSDEEIMEAESNTGGH